jgi:hypothetical protein
MIHAHIDKRSAVPWWAAFGAPLIGVPILVALLALGGTRDANAGVAKDAEAGYVTEQTEAAHAPTVLPVVQVEVEVDPASHC